ncbi:hypothetical protein [Sphingobium wenxiniae]|uniref:hypothetical protein n=1 Tax=Sphingobium wenxiniae (strain DSM 21828 / CGMCC 1.7748 / JZ-1) TaxID=595605 RepID=UPI001A7F03E8|nr:hypothetical protein [Sphingobium wenxiniae]
MEPPSFDGISPAPVAPHWTGWTISTTGVPGLCAGPDEPASARRRNSDAIA